MIERVTTFKLAVVMSFSALVSIFFISSRGKPDPIC